jgi:leader peptidase (prepilin peptidase)/N-methyltransferase
MFRSDILLAVPAPYDNAAAVHHAALLGETEATVTMLPWIGDAWIMAALLGSVGLAASVVLLLLGILPRSFELDQPEADLTITTDDAEPAEEPEELPLHPHPRREVGKELLFLGIPLLGFLVGWIVFHDLFTGSPWVLRVLGGVLIGYLVGGGIVWAVRILGTLGFGKEAMGLGDVHLMAAVGAVCGWQIAVIAFFVAPFFGLAYALLAFGAGRLMKREVRVIPYGPHLAVATLVVLAGREWLLTEFMLRFHL